MTGKLTICPTPLGNLGDMPPRALEALRAADAVCAEDTRVTGKLLAAFDIHVRLERLDEASLGAKTDRIIERVQTGEKIAYCSDAGMPGVSDPGQRLVEAARDAGVPLEVLPGPTAVATAYVNSGFLCPRFYFGGFFPRKAGERTRTLAALHDLDSVLIFYESPNRVVEALAAIAAALPHRRVAVCRELTKIHEEVVRGAAGEIAQEFARRQEQGQIRGEFVLVIDAPPLEEQTEQHESTRDVAAACARQLLAESALSRKDIVKRLQADFGLKRNDAYELLLSCAQESD